MLLKHARTSQFSLHVAWLASLVLESQHILTARESWTLVK